MPCGDLTADNRLRIEPTVTSRIVIRSATPVIVRSLIATRTAPQWHATRLLRTKFYQLPSRSATPDSNP
jgi:hypothetical protein